MLEIRKRARVPPERFTGNMTVKQLDEASGVSRET
jgi:hypothetical protein